MRYLFILFSFISINTIAQKSKNNAKPKLVVGIVLDQMRPDFLVRFNQKFSDLSPQAFVKELLMDRCGMRGLVVGDDFHFGKNRAGNFDVLHEGQLKFSNQVVLMHFKCSV